MDIMEIKDCIYCGEALEPISMKDAINSALKKHGGKGKAQLTSDQIAFWAKHEQFNLRLDQMCSRCGEKPFCPNPITDEEIIKRGYAAYEEFKEFMEGVKLPEEIIIKTATTQEFDGEVIFDERLNKFVATINNHHFATPYDIRPIFFHEFSHIVDKYDADTGGQRDNVNDVLWHSESYASQIEMMARLGFENINHQKEIDLSTKLTYMNKPVTLLEYFNIRITNSLESINEHNGTVLTKLGIVLALRRISYYHGMINFCKDNLDSDSVAKLPSMSLLENFIKERIMCPTFAKEFSRLMKGIDDIDDISETVNQIYYLIDIYAFGEPKLKEAYRNNLIVQEDSRLTMQEYYEKYPDRVMSRLDLDALEKKYGVKE